MLWLDTNSPYRDSSRRLKTIQQRSLPTMFPASMTPQDDTVIFDDDQNDFYEDDHEWEPTLSDSDDEGRATLRGRPNLAGWLNDSDSDDSPRTNRWASGYASDDTDEDVEALMGMQSVCVDELITRCTSPSPVSRRYPNDHIEYSSPPEPITGKFWNDLVSSVDNDIRAISEIGAPACTAPADTAPVKEMVIIPTAPTPEDNIADEGSDGSYAKLLAGLDKPPARPPSRAPNAHMLYNPYGTAGRASASSSGPRVGQSTWYHEFSQNMQKMRRELGRQDWDNTRRRNQDFRDSRDSQDRRDRDCREYADEYGTTYSSRVTNFERMRFDELNESLDEMNAKVNRVVDAVNAVARGQTLVDTKIQFMRLHGDAIMARLRSVDEKLDMILDALVLRADPQARADGAGYQVGPSGEPGLCADADTPAA